MPPVAPQLAGVFLDAGFAKIHALCAGLGGGYADSPSGRNLGTLKLMPSASSKSAARPQRLYHLASAPAGVAALRREVNDFGDMLHGNLYKKQWQEMTPDFNAVSPINAIAKIKTPLMLIHGKRDVTVDHVQSQKMYNAMTKAGKDVEFVSLPLADHYFTREDDRIKLLSLMEAFLAKHNPAS